MISCRNFQNGWDETVKERRISVVVASLNEGRNLRRTLRSLVPTLPEHSEILVVDDGSTDGSADFLAGAGNGCRVIRSNHLGSAGARNYGASKAGGDVIVFADAHVTVQPGWWKPMLELLEDRSVGAVAPAVSDMADADCKGFGVRWQGPDLETEWLPKKKRTPYQVPILPGCCFAIRRQTFEEAGGFEPGTIRWGSEDAELSLRLWLMGLELWLTPQIVVAHLFRRRHPYQVEWSWVLHNKLHLAFVHFGAPRISRVVDALRRHEDFPAALALTVESGAPARRAAIGARRVRDDAWFFRKFGPDW